MIYVNLKPVKVEHFPDGTQMLLDMKVYPHPNANKVNMSPKFCDIFWRYENDEECMTLWYIVNHIREHDPDVEPCLSLLYCPNARMDRTKGVGEVFTLKYFAKFINELKFKHVIILDPHSNVAPALIDRSIVVSPEDYIQKAIDLAFEDVDEYKDMYVYFPDAGAMKRYADLKCFKKLNLVYGEKVRDWSTGQIKGLTVKDRNGDNLTPTVFDDGSVVNPLTGKTVLMVDDIISYGGTFYYSAKALKELGAKEIFAYATHTENSVLDKENGTFIKCLEDGTVTKLFTTTSLFNREKGNSDKIYTV